MRTETGFIGFFDILGYQNILENNPPEAIAETILDRLVSLDDHLVRRMAISFPDFEDTFVHTVYRKYVKWLVFSDTILIYVATPDSIPKSELRMRWLAFYATCVFLQNSMLAAGLPLRGAIAYGPYLIQDACFAGIPIVEAYSMTQDLDLSACVFTEGAYSQSQRIDPPDDHDISIVEYLVPLKHGGEKKLPTLNYLAMPETTDFRSLVLEAFWAFNKDIPLAVQQKIINTEQHIRFLSQLNSRASQEKSGERPKMSEYIP